MGRELTLPSVRLTAAAELAAAVLFDGENGRNLSAVDVGCDHAKLAIYLVQSGICKHVLACDINEGPVQKARENVKRRRLMSEPLENYITVMQNDGLNGLDGVDANRIFILGMGGELISDIIEKAAYLRDTNRKAALILQAMTSEYQLRNYLYNNGYDIVKEQLVKDKGRVYSIILAKYDGVIRMYNDCILTVGQYNISNRCSLFDEYLERKIRIQEKLVMQLKKAGAPGVEKEEKLLLALSSLR